MSDVSLLLDHYIVYGNTASVVLEDAVEFYLCRTRDHSEEIPHLNSFFSFLVFCSSVWQVFTNSVFIVCRLGCSKIASSNLCSKDLAFSLAEWAVPS